MGFLFRVDILHVVCYNKINPFNYLFINNNV